jgi:hypothetical protein
MSLVLSCVGYSPEANTRLESSFVLVRGPLLFGAVHLLSTMAILWLIELPTTPLLRYAVLAVPLIAACIVVVEWQRAKVSRTVSQCRQELTSALAPSGMRLDRAA